MENDSTQYNLHNPNNEMEVDSRKRPRVDFPLQGVIVCLSGLTHDLKNQLHDMIESLGGR